MKIIEPYVEVYPFDGKQIVKNLELYARTAYKSEGNITDSSASFLSKIIRNGHLSVLEHEAVTVKFVVDRGISHEIVRHRLASYTQESTRYCNYSKDRFGNEITVIRPFWLYENAAGYFNWLKACKIAEEEYMNLLLAGWTPQQARTVLPSSLKTEVVTTYNIREWRHFFALRCAADAHPQMQQVAIPLFLYFAGKISPLFLDVSHNHRFLFNNYAKIKGV